MEHIERMEEGRNMYNASGRKTRANIFVDTQIQTGGYKRILRNTGRKCGQRRTGSAQNWTVTFRKHRAK
jgi:hypothetical protein